jgi:hypothetical protein
VASPTERPPTRPSTVPARVGVKGTSAKGKNPAVPNHRLIFFKQSSITISSPAPASACPPEVRYLAPKKIITAAKVFFFFLLPPRISPRPPIHTETPQHLDPTTAAHPACTHLYPRPELLTAQSALMNGRPSVFTSQDYLSDHLWKSQSS